MPGAGLADGVNLYGHLSGRFGLGVAGRNTLRALAATGRRVCAIDLDGGSGSALDPDLAHLVASDPRGIHPVSLFHTNPPDLRSYATEAPRSIWSRDRLRACVPFWELPRIPEGVWRDMLAGCDVVMAPSRFVADAVAASIPDARVVHYPQAAFPPSGVAPDRDAWGIPGGAFACLVAFDVRSGFERKNPRAAVAAFQAAFDGLGPRDVRLIVKMQSGPVSPAYDSMVDRFRESCASDPRIALDERSLDYRDVVSLNASCDALISLHRSEGLGLHLMEAMSLGTAVVSTAWSGTMDFTDERNSCLVPYATVPVETLHPNYDPDLIGEGQTWADPDVAAAAAALRRLRENEGFRHELAGRAAADMEALRAQFLGGAALDRVDEALRAIDPAGPEHVARTERFSRVVSVSAVRRLRRQLGNAVRRSGLL